MSTEKERSSDEKDHPPGLIADYSITYEDLKRHLSTIRNDSSTSAVEISREIVGRHIQYDDTLIRLTNIDFGSTVESNTNFLKDILSNFKAGHSMLTTSDITLIIKRCSLGNVDLKGMFGGLEIDHSKVKGIKLPIKLTKTISISNSIVEGDVTARGTIFEKRLEVRGITFHGGVDFRYATFNDLVLFRKCTFSKVPQFKHATFKRLADFGESTFNDEKEGKKGSVYGLDFFGTRFEGTAFFDKATFERTPNLYGATFDERLLLRDASFLGGLNLDDAVLKNGLDSDGITGIDKSNTSRRTFRILKSEALEVNNAIEASRYHSLEMNRYLKELWAELIPKKNTEKTFFMRLVIDWLKNFGSLVVFFIHKCSSNFATSWLLPLFWIVVVGFVTYRLSGEVMLVCDNDDLCPQGFFLSIVDYMILLNRDAGIDNAAVYAFNKASLGFLYYQFIRAVRHKLR